ncbi:hypothetical protein [Desulfuromonas sp. TF]|uniref:hypothetical protein n=1 Tax=Desulfuromonas sp. TF TaxID=1232410 RepID=UPI000410B344|nr:hypothetical protein [Desulfuromonas sp. TF]
MHIKLSPQRRDDALEVEKAGDLLTINGLDYDFSPLPAGASLPASAIECEWIVGDVYRSVDGVLEVTLILPHGANPAPEQAFPSDIVNPPDGVISLPGSGGSEEAK